MKKIHIVILSTFFTFSLGNAQVVTNNTNVGVGPNILGNTSTTIRNIAVGNEALKTNYSSVSNNALGYKALNVNTTGYFNIGIGSFSMFVNTMGYANTAVGHKTLYSNTTGFNNVAFGYESLYSNTIGSYNTSVGTKALQYNDNSLNSSFGYQSLVYSKGFANSGFGAYSLRYLGVGDENIALGYQAGQNITQGFRNIAIGTYNGAKGPSNYNIIIGWKSGTQVDESYIGDNNIIIGKRVSLAPGTTNAMNIGGVLFGKGFKSSESAWTGVSNGQIGINVINPSATLDVNGNAKISSTLVVNGHLAIGTTNTTEALTVKGKIHAEEVIVDLAVPVADYVFANDYTLKPLDEVEQYVKENSHLPEVPSAAQIKENGMKVGEMQNILLKKIEEMTLYIIHQQKEIEALKAEMKSLKK